MKIGITYDLRQYYLSQGMGEEETAEFDRPDTIDWIDNTLRELGHDTDRIGNIKNRKIAVTCKINMVISALNKLIIPCIKTNRNGR